MMGLSLVCIGIVVVLVIVAVVVIVLVLLLGQPKPPPQEEERPWVPPQERQRRPEAPARGPAGIDVRIGEDGFWIVAPGTAAGSTIQYRCRVRGRLEQGSITFEPGPQGQFVYTGGRPSDIEILQVDPPRGIAPMPTAGWEEPLPPIVSAPPPPSPPARPTSRPTTGFPTAY